MSEDDAKQDKAANNSGVRKARNDIGIFLCAGNCRLEFFDIPEQLANRSWAV